MKAFSAACERNKDPILRVLQQQFRHGGDILEIGSGTGQHAAFFGAHLPRLRWQPSDLPGNLPSIRAWVEEQGAANVLPPLALDVDHFPWPVERADAVFTANTAHIIAWASVVNLFRGVGRILGPGGALCLYGPLNYNGRYTSDSNAAFDQWLRQRDPVSGIRDFEALDRLANEHGMALQEDHAMPANNRLVVWRKAPRATAAQGAAP